MGLLTSCARAQHCYRTFNPLSSALQRHSSLELYHNTFKETKRCSGAVFNVFASVYQYRGTREVPNVTHVTVEQPELSAVRAHLSSNRNFTSACVSASCARDCSGLAYSVRIRIRIQTVQMTNATLEKLSLMLRNAQLSLRTQPHTSYRRDATDCGCRKELQVQSPACSTIARHA